MRIYSSIVLQSFVSGTAAVYSLADTFDKLGQGDATAFHIIAKQVAGSLPVELTFDLETSSDGELWTTKTLSPVISGEEILAAQSNVLFTADDGSVPSCGLARVRVQLSSGGAAAPQAAITVWACGRSR
jgi:hypothetical protein